VRERATTTGPLHAVVIPGLGAGAYELWLDGAVPLGAAEVLCGRVTEVNRRRAIPERTKRRERPSCIAGPQMP
jgi:hypothetical protein